MPERGMDEARLLESLLELASGSQLEVRILSASSVSGEFAPTTSAACRVGERIWIALAPDDPVRHQAEILGRALGRYRSEFLETHFMAPGVREFLDGLSLGVDSVDPIER